MFVKLEDAIETVLDLAKENVIDPRDARDNDMPLEHERQQACIDTVEDFFVNHVFE